MQHLNRAMMARYDIPDHRPTAVRAVQFGLGEALLGVVDRLFDEAAPDVGIACVPSAEDRRSALLREQDGMYTMFVRGYRGEALVNREAVVQAITGVVDADGEAFAALAASGDLALGIVDADAETLDADLAHASRLLDARRRAGLGGLAFVCVGDAPDAGARVRAQLAERIGDGAFAAWLDAACAFYPALCEGFAFRAEAREAAKLCADMNYADGMIHTAEPFARLTVDAPAAFCAAWLPEGAAGVCRTDDLAGAVALKRRLFDAGLFALAAPGWLLGCDALDSAMKHARLRDFLGRAYMDELLPGLPREIAAPRVIETFERFENPLSRNPILAASRPLLRRFRLGALPVIRERAAEDFEPPRRLAFALAATIMLYAGARKNAETGAYEVLRGRETCVLDDDPAALAVFATLSHDMPPETLAYAALADRALWGEDLRDIDGLEARVALDLAALQRDPSFLPA